MILQIRNFGMNLVSCSGEIDGERNLQHLSKDSKVEPLLRERRDGAPSSVENSPSAAKSRRFIHAAVYAVRRSAPLQPHRWQTSRDQSLCSLINNFIFLRLLREHSFLISLLHSTLLCVQSLRSASKEPQAFKEEIDAAETFIVRPSTGSASFSLGLTGSK